jgi:hypothetical protein
MNTLQRPLFRQAGGPAEMMPAGVAALPQADPAAMVAAVEQTTAQDMEKVGQEYVQGVSQGLDDAESFKEVIDSLRGNAMPLEERYLELSEYVGEDDAEKTPESVLAMVQPVIMMTEEGNVDSGIGELMQKLAGEIDMVTEAGAPTQMGQGLGGLMAANQEVPVQKFANGGIVQHFANGAGVNQNPTFTSSLSLPNNLIRRPAPDLRVGIDQLKSRLPQTYQEVLPLYQGIINPQQQRDLAKSQIMFDIAQAGLNFAGGIDPRTGQAMTGRALGSQLAAAASGLPQQIGERVAAQRQQEQGAQLAALQMAGDIEKARVEQVGSERGLGAQISQRSELAIFDKNATSALNNQGASLKDQLAANEAARVTAENDKNVGRQKELYQEEYRLRTNLANNNFQNDLVKIEENFQNNGDLRELQSGLDTARDNLNYQHQKDMQDDRQEFLGKYKDAELELATRAADLSEAMYKDSLKRLPSTKIGSNLSGFLFLDSEADAARQIQDQRAAQLFDLTVEAQRIGMNTQMLNNYINNNNYRLNVRKQNFVEETTYLGQLIDRELAMNKQGLQGMDSNQMNALLMSDQAARAYGLGASMPEYEYALSQKFKTSFDPNSGLRITANMPPYLKSAIEARQKGGFTAFSPDMTVVERIASQQGYAKGGEIKHMANGGDPSKGLFEPTTGRFMARPPEPEKPITFDEPIISDLEGLDITKGTGSDAFLKQAVNKISTALFTENAPYEETEEAVRTLDSFTQIALTRALGSLAGRENRELQERLAKLQVPAAEFFYNDSEALAQFKASSRVMDFAIREQQSVMQGPGLTRTERNKAKKDLASLKSIRSEYDNLAAAYSRKLEGDTEAVSKQLDQFFN